MDGFLMERTTRGQLTLAGVLVLAMLGAFGLTAPQATVQLRAVAPFMPMCGLTVFTTAGIVAFLLVAQFQLSRLPVIGLLAGAYAFAALTVAMQLLTFPGLFSETGLLGAHPTTAGWIWAFWHGGFPTMVLLAMIARYIFKPQAIERLPRAGLATLWMVGLPLAVGVALCVVVVMRQLPPALAPATSPGAFSSSPAALVLLLVNLASLAAVLSIGRLRTVLDLWVAVAVFACLTDTVLSLMSTVRFSVGWYVARLFSMSAPGILLCVLVWEVTRLYRELTRAHLRLIEYSNRDALTGIFNRRYFNERFPRDFEQARRRGEAISLLMVDVDHFKVYNDRYGHPVGDECLAEVARALMRSTQRPNDMSARYGGEEFVIVLPDTDARGALFVASRAREAVLALGRPGAGPTNCVTVSVGCATMVPGPGSMSGTLVALADEALYTAKRLGRNRVQVAVVSEAATGTLSQDLQA